VSLYVKLQTEIITDAKILMAGPEGFTLWAKGLAYSKQHLTDGYIPQECLQILGVGLKKPEQIARKLCEIGLWENVEGGYTVGTDKWAKHQTTKEDVELKKAQNAERQRRYREGRNLDNNVSSNALHDALVTLPEPEPEPEYRVQSTETVIPVGTTGKPVVFNQEQIYGQVGYFLSEVAKQIGASPPTDAEIRQHIAKSSCVRKILDKCQPMSHAIEVGVFGMKTRPGVGWQGIWAGVSSIEAKLAGATVGGKIDWAKIEREAKNRLGEGVTSA